MRLDHDTPRNPYTLTYLVSGTSVTGPLLCVDFSLGVSIDGGSDIGVLKIVSNWHFR